MARSDVLIAGAGPTGLVLALYLAKCGVRARIVDKSVGPGEQSRAMVVQARTLEFYRQLGMADDVIESGIKIEKIHLRRGHTDTAVFELKNMGGGLSPYPFGLTYPQDEHERFLVARLKEHSIEVERETELLEVSEDDDHVRAVLRTPGGGEAFECAYLCGCDGAHSTVRQALGLGFAGGTYDQVFFVADVQAAGDAANQDLNFCIGTNTLCLVFPIRTSGMNRLIGLIPEELRGRESITFEDIRPHVERLVGITVEKLNWFSIYHVHHRVADHFRKGRSFLLGDAGHIHSPAGGQGMNTGIGDAVNLSWKLAASLAGESAPAVLDSYETERIAFAHQLVDTTDRAFTLMVGSNISSRVFRSLIVPHLLPFAFGFSPVRRVAFRTVSQTQIRYHQSPLSEGAAGEVRGGDRLPWVGSLDNFARLTSFDWQLHVYGAAGEALTALAERRRIPLHVFGWSPDVEQAGLAKDAVYLIRPDGYVSFASEKQEAPALEAFVERLRIEPRDG